MTRSLSTGRASRGPWPIRLRARQRYMNYQETPYFAAILRAFSSSVSRRFAWRFFTGLEGLAVGCVVASGAVSWGAAAAAGAGAGCVAGAAWGVAWAIWKGIKSCARAASEARAIAATSMI